MDETGTVILGAGLTGLSAGCRLARNGVRSTVLEASPHVGGLARTEQWADCLFDLGGHRFHTSNADIEAFVMDLMGEELLRVSRSSKILLKGRYFDYPLRPGNALGGLGLKEAVAILGDYALEKAKSPWHGADVVSLRDRVIRDFGKRLFSIFFRDYSEKVWGLSCESISADWIEKRIQGLSLGKAVRSALSRKKKGSPATLTDSFYYPSRGIGRISERLAEEVRKCGGVQTGRRIASMHHDGTRIKGITVDEGGTRSYIPTQSVISTIPLPALLNMFRPRLPEKILAAASGLRYRDLLVAALAVDRPRVTDQTWIYFPDRNVPFGRLHEPKNWSAAMAPPDRTTMIVEYFCFAGDRTWTTSDEHIADLTASALEGLGFFRKSEMSAFRVVRVPKAYPLFDVEYVERLEAAESYLKRFENLRCAGRTGSFRYLNMDEAIASGLEAAESFLAPGRESTVSLQAGAGR